MTSAPRRQRLSADERRTQIVAATVAVLAEGGYQAASADAIARAAGVSKGLLWHYFGSQDELMLETARRTLVVLRRAVGESLDLDAPAPQVVRAALRAVVGLLGSPERRALEAIVANLRTAEGASVLTLADYDDTYASQEAILRRGQEAGDLRVDLDPRLLAVTYQGAVDSMLGYLEEHPELDALAYADLVADVLLGGMQS